MKTVFKQVYARVEVQLIENEDEPNRTAVLVERYDLSSHYDGGERLISRHYDYYDRHDIALDMYLETVKAAYNESRTSSKRQATCKTLCETLKEIRGRV